MISSEEQKEKRMKKSEKRLKDLQNIIKWTHICIMGVLEGKEREKRTERLFEEIMTII